MYGFGSGVAQQATAQLGFARSSQLESKLNKMMTFELFDVQTNVWKNLSILGGVSAE